MSAGDRWHEHGAVKGGDPTVSPAVLLWIKRQGTEEQSDLPLQDAENAFRPEAAPADGTEGEDVLANLLHAIQNTEVASLFQNAVPPDPAHAAADARHEPVESAQIEFAFSKLAEANASAAASTEPTPPVDIKETNEAVAMLLRAIQNTHAAAELEGAAKPDGAEVGLPAVTLGAGAAEALSAALQAPEVEAPTHHEATAPQATPATVKSSAATIPDIQSASTSAEPEGAAKPDNAEAGLPTAMLRTAAAETRAAVPHAPEKETTAHLEAAVPQVAPETGKPSAATLDILQSSKANPSPESDQPARVPAETAIFTPEKSAEAPKILEAPVVREPQSTSKQENRPPKRSGRRLSGKQRLDYLLSIAAPKSIDEPTVAPREAAEPKPAHPLTVLEARVDEKLEQPPITAAAGTPLSVEPESIPASQSAGDTPAKAPILAKLGTGIGSLAATGDLINNGLNRAEMHLENWFQKWFGPPDPRHTVRVEKPPLVAYHWIVDVPQALKIADVSAGGLRLITRDRWSEGNIISMTLQRTDREQGSPDSWIAVDFLVMRWCEDGVAGAFMLSAPGLAYTVAGRAGNCADKKTLERFMEQLIDASTEPMAVSK